MVTRAVAHGAKANGTGVAKGRPSAYPGPPRIVNKKKKNPGVQRKGKPTKRLIKRSLLPHMAGSEVAVVEKKKRLYLCLGRTK